MQCEMTDYDYEAKRDIECERKAEWIVQLYAERDVILHICDACSDELGPEWRHVCAVDDGPEERPEPLTFANTGCR